MQTWIVYVIGVLAVGYLGRVVWNNIKGKGSSCCGSGGGCNGCGSANKCQ